MALVLALGVQGIADAVGTLTPGFTTSNPSGTENLGWLNIGSTITLDIDGASADNTNNVKESVYVHVSGGRANFPHPTTANRTVTSYTWNEERGTTDPEDYTNGTLTIRNDPVITVNGTGEVKVTVSWTSATATSNTRDESLVRTYYVVRPAAEINPNDTINLLNVTNGVGAGYSSLSDVEIYRGDNRHNPITYTTTGGVLYVKEGTQDNKATATTSLSTSSSANVWLSMGADVAGENSHTVTAPLATGFEATGTYIYGPRPKLEVTPDSALSSGNPGQKITTAITATVTDKNDDLTDGGVVPGVPVKFEVADKSNTGSYLIPNSAMTIVDAKNEVITPRPTTAKILYVRTEASGAIVDVQLASTPGNGEITVSVVGKNVNVSEKVTVGTPSTELSIISDAKRAGNSKIFDLVARVMRGGKPLRGLGVTFQTTRGDLANTPTEETGITNPDGGSAIDDDQTTSSGLNAIDITDRNGYAQVRYNIGDNSGRQEIDAIIYSSDANKRRIVTFAVNGAATTKALNIAVSGSGNTRTVRVTSLLNGTSQPGISVDLSVSPSTASLSPTSGSTPFSSTLTLPETAGTYTLRALTDTDYRTDTETVTITDTATNTATETQGASLSLEVTGTGTTRTVTVTATNAEGGNVPGLDVTLRGSALVGGARTVRVGTPERITVTTGTLQAAATGFATAEETITVGPGGTPQGTSGTDTLTVQKDGAQVGTQQTLLVTASPAPSSPVDFTVTRGGVTVGSGTILTTGSGRGIVTVPTTGLYVLTVTAPGYASQQVTFTAGEQQQQPQQQQPQQQQPQQQQPTGSAPSSITISGLSAHSGTVNQPLDAPLAVRVLDANGVGVGDARVIFRVVGQGQGRLSQRGNGRAIPKETDRNGFARADFTPLGAGIITVEAEARGVTERVTFTITTGSVPPGPGDSTPSTTTTVSPVVNAGVSADSRPPMLWISGGKIYALVGSEVKVFIASVDNATNLAVGGGKVYWTAKTSDTHGTLNSANLDGSDAKELRTLWGVPRGITVDTAGSRIYWVDAADRLQRAALDGSGIENVIRGLSEPKHVAVSGGNAYWVGNGSGTDTLSFIRLTDPTKTIHPIASTLGTYGGLAIAGNKLYWTEKTSDTHGTLHAANLDGTGARELRDDPIWGAPIGIAVDTARSHLYWTDAAGRLQRSNLDASGIHNVAKGLGTPRDMVLSNSITAPAATTTTTTTTTPSNKYDVNGDGTVDSKDVDAIIVAVAAKITDAKYDVNADGKVDINDVVAVSANRDNGAATAPALLGTKFSALEVERLQEQIDLLIATGDRSPAAMRTLVYLQQLLVMARPEKTQLLANYPNPFNPETWIPYELAADTDVRITIYNAQGVVIRTLQLGQQSAGYYTDRQRAAYWDGRNALGEHVASGVYFYQLETDEMSTLRKMVILK